MKLIIINYVKRLNLYILFIDQQVKIIFFEWKVKLMGFIENGKVEIII